MLLLAGCGGGGAADAPQAAPPPAPVVAPGTWVVLGSSSAAGTGASSGQGWASQLQGAAQARQVVLQNIARNGTLTYQALATGSNPPAGRPAPDTAVNITRALQFAPKLVLLSFPTNDTAAGYTADETAANLLALQRAAQAAGAAALVLGVQPRDGLTGSQRAVLADLDQRLAAQAGPCFVALFAALADGNGHIAAAYAAGDGIHLNDAGHRVVRERVQAVLDGGRCVRLAAAR
ncbi:SGNH/GDSL hydrolase family protein [Rubrivivax sp. RP6-9]|uniref:SGNH/GDSL hydrolase family protein n=1 Tax=Rubrivivax sp. RP6-9 TaxID=3415750 RepID=UPI003CC57534